MRITYYRLPQELSAREQYRILKAEGYCNKPEPPQDLTDEEIRFFQERFKYPEMFFKTNGKFIAVPYEPEQEIER